MANEVTVEPPTFQPARSVRDIRAHFPGLQSSELLVDNAGGSQVPASVADAIRDYYLKNYVQVGADYAASRRATETVASAHAFVNMIFGGEGFGEVVLGPSTSALINMLAECVAREGAGRRNEIIVSEANHESNIGPWARLEQRGFTIRLWKVDPERMTTPLDQLASLLSERTRLVAIPHVTNIFGAVEDVQAACRMARAAGARTVVDSVAFAPHRPLDVADIGADWCVYSTYKVYGPHMAALFGAHEAMAELEGPNHYFVPRTALPRKFELGGVNHEGCAGLLGLWPYLSWLADAPAGSQPNRADIVKAFARMGELEFPLQSHLIDWLNSRRDIRVIGPATAGPERVPTVSFVVRGRSSKEVAQILNRQGIGVRSGDFYSRRLVEAMKLSPEDGVVRASFVHYNTIEEVDHLTTALEAELR